MANGTRALVSGSWAVNAALNAGTGTMASIRFDLIRKTATADATIAVTSRPAGWWSRVLGEKGVVGGRGLLENDLRGQGKLGGATAHSSSFFIGHLLSALANKQVCFHWMSPTGH